MFHNDVMIEEWILSSHLHNVSKGLFYKLLKRNQHAYKTFDILLLSKVDVKPWRRNSKINSNDAVKHIWAINLSHSGREFSTPLI